MPTTDTSLQKEGNIVEPKPDPWAPPGAMAYQAGSIGTGATGAALLLSSEPSTGTVDGLIAWLPDPAQLFGRVAHVLGFGFDVSTAWTWGLILVILSVALNIYSYLLRYQYAKKVERESAEQQAANAAKEMQLVAQANRAGGFTPGDA
jgi:hypothetical protein